MRASIQHPSGRALRLLVVLAFALAAGAAAGGWLAAAAQEDSFKPKIPLGLPADTWTYYVPRTNPLTAPKVELGRRLFFDARLSADGKVSCATCHDPKLAFTDGKAVAEGVGGRRGTRNSPSLLNVTYNAGQFWDGRADSLEDQAHLPLVNPVEMGNASYDEVVARLGAIPEYRASFAAVFGGPVTIKAVAEALACYQRTLVSGDAPIDRFLAGQAQALTDSARRGFALFRGKARCSRCHTFSEQQPFFSDFAYHNTGVAAGRAEFGALARRAFDLAQRPGSEAELAALGREPGGDELGRALVTYQVFDIGSFKTPSLRNVALTAPYFHDGSAPSLAEVVRFYNGGGRGNLNREWDLHPLSLSDAEQRDLVAFLESLTGKVPDTED